MPKEKKKALGRGLAALIPSGDAKPRLGSTASEVVLGNGRAATKGKDISQIPQLQYQEVPLTDIVPNPKQPRNVFAETELAELVHSIKEFGLLQPIVVRPAEGKFELVMGERRWRASQQAGLKTIPAIIRNTPNENLLRDALLENIHRVQLNPVEEAAAYQQLLDEFKVTHEELADRLGRSRPTVTNLLRLLKLPVEVQKKLIEGSLSVGHARALLAIDSAQVQEELATKIVQEGLSVRQVESLITATKTESVGRETASKTSSKNNLSVPKLKNLAEQLSTKYATKSKVIWGKNKGKIVIEFSSIKDFERIYQQLMD